MLNMLTSVIKKAVVEGKSNGQSASLIADRIDMDILDILLAFIDKHPSFHSFTKSIELSDLEAEHRGSFHLSVLGDVVINRSLVKGVTKRVAIGTGDMLLKQLIVTMLHEHRHAYQHRNKLPMCKVPYPADPFKDREAYWNHPMEVDAREYAEMYAEEAMGYVIYGLRKKYLDK